MTQTRQRLAWLAVLTLGLATAAASPVAAKDYVTDDGHFFSEAAVRRANRDIADMHQKIKHELVVETFAEIPAERQADFDKDKKAFFQAWALERARDRRVNGVYVLICKKPSHFEIKVGNETSRAFTSEHKQELFDILKSKLGKDNDEALRESMSLVASVLENYHRQGGAAGRGEVGHQASSPLLRWLFIGLAVLVGMWLLFALIRAFSGGGGGYGGGGYGGGGGGFMSSLLGGLFGAAAGMWMYNSFFGGGTSSAFGGTSDAGGGAADLGQDTDYSGSGGDFGGDGGGDAGGGDFGGGDAGGGDFGGGDFGGGDFGGGGGDFGGGDF